MPAPERGSAGHDSHGTWQGHCRNCAQAYGTALHTASDAASWLCGVVPCVQVELAGFLLPARTEMAAGAFGIQIMTRTAR